MKISKKKLVESVKLTEGEDEEVATIAANGEIGDTAIAIEKGVEAASDGELTVEPGQAAQAAVELQKAAQEVDTDEEDAAMLPGETKTETNIVIENKLTRKLDRCLSRAQKYQRRGNKVGANLLVSGLPGSGKTACVTA